MIDSHAHLNYQDSYNDVASVISSFKSSGGKKVVDVSTGVKELVSSLSLADTYAEIVCSFGVHPERVHRNGGEDINSLISEFQVGLQKIRKHDSYKGIGETGYDIYGTESDDNAVIEKQDILFLEHLKAAQDDQKPVVIHIRDKDTQATELFMHAVAFLQQHRVSSPLYFHSFGGQLGLLTKINDLDGYVGVNGIISYKSAADLQVEIRNIPKNRLVLETDSPFLIPSNALRETFVDKKTNEPISIKWIAAIVAKLRGESPEDVLEYTTENATRLFSL